MASLIDRIGSMTLANPSGFIKPISSPTMSVFTALPLPLCLKEKKKRVSTKKTRKKKSKKKNHNSQKKGRFLICSFFFIMPPRKPKTSSNKKSSTQSSPSKFTRNRKIKKKLRKIEIEPTEKKSELKPETQKLENELESQKNEPEKKDVEKIIVNAKKQEENTIEKMKDDAVVDKIHIPKEKNRSESYINNSDKAMEVSKKKQRTKTNEELNRDGRKDFDVEHTRSLFYDIKQDDHILTPLGERYYHNKLNQSNHSNWSHKKKSSDYRKPRHPISIKEKLNQLDKDNIYTKMMMANIEL